MIISLAVLSAACVRETESVPPTATPEPIALPTIQPTPVAWLLTTDEDQVRIYEAGTGRQVELPLPPLWRPSVDLQQNTGISSTGLLAVRTASDPELPEDIALAIIRLRDGQALAQIPLLSERLQDHMKQDPGFEDTYARKQDVYAAVLDSSVAPRWSPNGRVVAFAAALEGPSTDVYSYDLERGELSRLTDESEQVVVLDWSPDGEWVVYGEAFGFDEEFLDYLMYSLLAVSTRTGEVRELAETVSGLPIEIVGWPTPSKFAMIDIDPGFGFWDLSLVDIDTQSVTKLAAALIESFAYDPVSKNFAFTVVDDWEVDPGLYLMSFNSTALQMVDAGAGEFWSIVRWIPELEQFVAASDQAVVAFSSEGKLQNVFTHESCIPSASPDGQWLAFGPCTSEFDIVPGLRIYDTGGALTTELETNFVEELVWKPDSAGLYYLMYGDSDIQLASVDIAEQETHIIDPHAGFGLTMVEVRSPDFEAIAIAVPQEPEKSEPPPTEIVPTPKVPLSDVGPWLVGRSRMGFVALNPDGSGRTEVRLAHPDFVQDSAISSAGWLAQIVEEADGIPRLLVTRLLNKEPFREIPIMSAELVERRDEIADNGMRRRWTDDVYLALNSYGFMVPMIWSPDGRNLAFVAATDGPSADVYVYDAIDDEVRRLTSGPNQPRLLGWSDDGKWILHLEIKDINAGEGVWWDTVALWAAAADGSELKKVPGIDEDVYLVNWSKPEQFMVVHDTYGPLPPFQFEMVDLNTGPIATLYPDYVYRWAVDPETETIAFMVDEYSSRGGEPLEEGLYLASPSRPTPQLVPNTDPEKDSDLYYRGDPIWSPELKAFMIPTEEASIALISTDGELIRNIDGACNAPLPSPDGRWLAFDSCVEWPPEFQVVSEEDGEIVFVSMEPFTDYFWAPDSSGLYYFVGEYPERLMYVAVPSGTPQLIHPDSGLQSGYWLPEWVSIP